MSGSREKLIRKKVDQRVDDHIEMFVDSVCRMPFRRRFVFVFLIITKQLKMDQKNKIFTKIKKHYESSNG